jgi:hypothetical protein
MIYFTGGLVAEGAQPRDAGAGTFYSAISNIDLTIEDGNPIAVGMRTHFAQHGFVSHSVINAGKGKAGISEVGNEMENVSFIGGDYGIICGTTSPSWPMMVLDLYFEGHRKAAIQSHNTGMAIIGMHAKNVPIAVEIREGDNDRLYMENCLFENIKEAGVVISNEGIAITQVNLLGIDCRNVPVFVKYRDSGGTEKVDNKTYRVKEYVYGLMMDNMTDDSEFGSVFDFEPSQSVPTALTRNIPALPEMSVWANVRDFGATGDGETDDTEAFRKAIAEADVVYVPQGWYRITGSLKMRPETKLIGLHPMGTQLMLQESTPAFSGFGGPVPMVESSEGGNNIFNGIGIRTGGYNYRAVGLKWMAGEDSYINDVKFVGGHGTMWKPVPQEQRQQTANTGNRTRAISSPMSPVYDQGMDQAWDNQYWSFWVTNNGGGVIKDVWTANTYATSGLYVSNTSTPAKIYAMSLEHHVRNEARFDNVANWDIYCFQLEEESMEGKECQMIELSDCNNINFNNLWMYRVIRVTTPKSFGARVWNCQNITIRNLHNYTQKEWVTEFTFWDPNKEIPLYPWELAKVTLTGNEEANLKADTKVGVVNRLVSGFDFAQGITADSKGNVYFCETRKKRIYKWDVGASAAKIIADYPFQPFVLATDSKDNLLAVFRYDPQPGYMVGGKQETVKRLPDDNVAYSSYGNSGWASYAVSFDLRNMDETFTPMPRVASASVSTLDKAFYPASRWHYTFDNAAAYYPDSLFMAPDGKTVIPETYDIGRCTQLTPAIPGEPFYASDELAKRLVRLDVAVNGKLSNLRQVLPRSEYATAIDNDGNLYVADGQIFVYDKNYKELDRINVPERPISMVFGGADGNTLFVTTETSLYSVRVK